MTIVRKVHEAPPRGEDGTVVCSEDLELMQAAIAGSQPARDALAVRLSCIGRVVAGRNARMGHGLDREELADVVQAVAASVWAHGTSYRGYAPLEAWVFAFCDHELRNAARRKRRRYAAESPLAEEPLARPALDTTLADELRDCLQRLAPWDQDAVRARHFEGLMLAELAVRFACKINTLKTRYYRSLQQLRECLEGKVGR